MVAEPDVSSLYQSPPMETILT